MTVEHLEPPTVADSGDDSVDAPASGGRSVTRVLVAVIAVAVLAVAVAGGYFWGSRGSGSSSATGALPGVNSVDAGFARDMATHHQQAITMAGYTRDNSTDPAVRLLAYDIETSQTIQMGEMEGWLDTWGISRTSGTQMSWMVKYMGSSGTGSTAHMTMSGEGLASGSGSMPGMATAAQMDKLQTLHGKALDILFLQLMIRHHQGGLPMERIAEQHAGESYVRTLAGNMLANQGTEIVQMEQLLRKLGAQPLPAPTY